MAHEGNREGQLGGWWCSLDDGHDGPCAMHHRYPSTESVRLAFITKTASVYLGGSERARENFDHWLAARDAAIRADALNEAALWENVVHSVSDPYYTEEVQQWLREMAIKFHLHALGESR